MKSLKKALDCIFPIKKSFKYISKENRKDVLKLKKYSPITTLLLTIIENINGKNLIEIKILLSQ